MSTKENFRIKVNLSSFFNDHRSITWLFINKKIKLFEDIEARLRNIFQITNFYLSYDSSYLPSTEDVDILNKDDIIWALPISNKIVDDNSLKSNSNCHNGDLNNFKTEKKKKKKCFIDENASDNEIKLKKKRRKHNEHDVNKIELNNKSDNLLNNSASSPNKLKNTVSGQELHSKSEPESKICWKTCLRTSEKSSSSDSFDIHNKSDNLQSDNKIKKNILKINGAKITNLIPPQKKTNIVKSIVVTNNSTKANNKSEADKIVNNTSNDSSEEMETVQGSSVTNDSNLMKRKRKRVRKRKNKNQPTEIIDLANNVEIIEKKPIVTNGAPLLHIRFDEATSQGADESIKLPEQINGEVKVNNDVETASLVVDNEFKGIKLKPNTPISETFILKQPLILNESPKIHDLISFKILRITDNYTPEISGFITGSVLNFNEETKEIHFDISHGLDQCDQPQGKFFMDYDDKDKVSDRIDTLRVFKWTDLLEPRLLFP